MLNIFILKIEKKIIDFSLSDNQESEYDYRSDDKGKFNNRLETTEHPSEKTYLIEFERTLRSYYPSVTFLVCNVFLLYSTANPA